MAVVGSMGWLNVLDTVGVIIGVTIGVGWLAGWLVGWWCRRYQRITACPVIISGLSPWSLNVLDTVGVTIGVGVLVASLIDDVKECLRRPVVVERA